MSRQIYGHKTDSSRSCCNLFLLFYDSCKSIQAEGSPSYALMDMVMGMIFVGVFIGIALGWLMYFNINVSSSEKENKDEDKSEE